ncbi:MAG TPA: right-handed parallel beta-helix repeat-containing protein [Chthoniobacteraceae bacterium]|nr:right-handed parallel beta-helix repeat-containing protein [Chthoniobacteraceae bacterium]
MKRNATVATLVLAAALLLAASLPGRPATEAVHLFVSPEGSDSGDGSRRAPYASVEKACSDVPVSVGGVITLLGGVYRENFRVPAPADPTERVAPLTIESAPGERVVLEGGEKITEWKPWNDEPGMYVVEASDITPVFPTEAGYLDVWSASARKRYRKQLDPAGVRAYPGSVCLLNTSHLLVHTHNGEDPGSVELWRNRAGRGPSISRPNVTIRGLSFRNYLGGVAARALTLTSNTEVSDCEFTNCVMGLSISREGARVLRCQLRDVGLGVRTVGVDTAVRDCLIQSASGAFAIGGDLNQHQRDGIRYYFPAKGGEISGNVTVGFWAGLYIKTGTRLPDARPMLIGHNTFLDGIRAGAGAFQPLNRYRCNIIGPNQEKVDPLKDDALKAAAFESNYFFAEGGSSGGSNRAGPVPFVDLAGGNLKLLADAKVGPCAENGGPGAARREARWSPAVAAALGRLTAPVEAAAQPFRFLEEPSRVSSARGALLALYCNAPATGTARYRKSGALQWTEVEVTPNSPATPRAVQGVVPMEWQPPANRFGFLVAITGAGVKPGNDYEYEIRLTPQEGEPLALDGKFHTRGGPREIHVRAGSDAAGADGSPDKPFPRLQAALDRALPGDSVRLGAGLYTAPAYLAHGGLPGAPLTISGVNERETIVDGGMEPPVLLELDGADHVVIRGIQFRWFGNAAISATGSTGVTVEKCRFQNGVPTHGSSVNGHGISLEKSPGWTVSHCLFTRLAHGVLAIESPAIKVRRNTAYHNLYTAVYLYQSITDSEVVENSFTFTGNDSLVIYESDPHALASFTCDYNNYAAALRSAAQARPENDFQPASRYGRLPPGKAIINGMFYSRDVNRFYTLEAWRKFSGKDAHSIFAEPDYADPLKGDFRLLPGSANLLPEGRILGAAGVKK